MSDMNGDITRYRNSGEYVTNRISSASWQERRRAGYVFGKRQKYMCLFIFTNVGSPTCESQRGIAEGVRLEKLREDQRIGLGALGGFTHVSNSNVGANVSSNSVIVPAGSPHPLRTVSWTRARNARGRHSGVSPLFFKTVLREATAPFVTALSGPPTVAAAANIADWIEMSLEQWFSSGRIERVFCIHCVTCKY